MAQFIEPDTALLLEGLGAQAGPKLHEMPVPDARAAVRALTQQLDLPCAAACETRDLGPDEAPVPARLYLPSANATGAVIVFAHGGGFVLGDLDTYDSLCRHIATRTGLRLLAPDYRLAPEHAFPAAFTDVLSTISWIATSPPVIGAPLEGIALAGDSAGAALCASCAAALCASCDTTERSDASGLIGALLLLYPVTDLSSQTESYRRFGTGYLLEAAAMELFARAYTPETADRRDPRASPLMQKDLSRMPRTTVLTCELDVLRDEGRAYASRLVAAGVETFYREARGQIHGMATLRRALPSARPVLDEVIDSLARQIAHSAQERAA